MVALGAFAVTAPLALTAVEAAAAQGSADSARIRRTCFRGRPEPRCHAFWVTEFAYTPRLNANPSGGGGPNYYFTWDVGGMVNSGARTALGGGVFLGGEDDGFRFGLRFRYRRWLNSTTGLDISPGILLAGGDNKRQPKFPGFTGSLGVMHRDLFGISAQLEVVRDTSGRVETAWYGGVKFASYPGIILSVAGPLLIVAVLGQSCIGLSC